MSEYLAVLRVERGLSSHTLSAYRRDLEGYLEFLSGADATVERIESYIGFLRRHGLATTTISRKVSALRGFHRYAHTNQLCSVDPTARLEQLPQPRSLPHALSVDRVLSLLATPDQTTVVGRRDRALLEFLYASGTRISEALGLDLIQLDLEDRVAIVTGKGAKQRMVPIGSAASTAIEKWLPDRSEKAKSNTEAVFLNLRGTRLSRSGAFRIIQQYAQQAGIGSVSPHTLRHSAATHMLEGGADLRTVQEYLGHAHLSTTQIYTMVSPQQLLEVYTMYHPRST